VVTEPTPFLDAGTRTLKKQKSMLILRAYVMRETACVAKNFDAD
jgi:hypothetical protein